MVASAQPFFDAYPHSHSNRAFIIMLLGQHVALPLHGVVYSHFTSLHPSGNACYHSKKHSCTFPFVTIHRFPLFKGFHSFCLVAHLIPQSLHICFATIFGADTQPGPERFEKRKDGSSPARKCLRASSSISQNHIGNPNRRSNLPPG